MVLQKIMDVSMSEIIRETRNAINSRLDMLEVLVNRSYYSNPMSNSNSGCDNHRMDTLFQKMATLENTYNMLEEKLNNANAKKLCDICKKDEDNCYCDMPPLEALPLLSSSKFILPEIVVKEEDDAIVMIKKEMNGVEKYCDECCGVCDGVHAKSGDMKSRGLEVIDNNIVKVEEEEVVEEVVEEAEEAEEAEEQEEQEAEQEQEEEQEVALELEEFEYKGMTLYRDTENKVYRMDEDNGISDPLGIWDEKSNKIKKIYNL